MDFTIIIAIIVLLVAMFGIYLYIKQKYPERPQNYRAMFVIGIMYIPLGIVLNIYTISFIGLVFFAIGIINKKKWRDDISWNEYSTKEKRIKIGAFIALFLMFLAGIFVYFFSGVK